MRKRDAGLWCAMASVLLATQLWAVTSTTITLNWTAPGDDGGSGQASVYDLRYSLAPITEANWASATRVTGVPAPKPAGSAESFTVTGLTPSTTYYFAIKTGDEVPNWSALSVLASRTTLAAPPTAPSLAAPANGATGVAVNPTVSWNAAAGATSYRVQVSTDSAFGTTVTDQSGVTAVSLALTGLSNNTTYYWRVSATNSGGTSAFSAVWRFTTTGQAVAATFQTLGNSTTTRLVSAGYTFISYALSGQAGYLDSLVVSMTNNGDGDDKVYGIIYSGSAGKIGALVARSRDRVVVKGSTLKSYVLHFSAGAVALAAVTPYYIGIHSLSTSGYTTVASTDNTTGRTGYAADPGAPNSLWNLSEYTNQNQIAMVAYYHAGAAGMAAVPPQIAVEGEYDSTEESNPLPPASIFTQNYPNPFNPSTTIMFSLPNASHVTLDIYNVLGQKIKSLLDVDLAAGEHRVIWGGVDRTNSPVPSGIYFYRLKAGHTATTRKMVLLK